MSELDGRSLRNVLGCYGTGVAIMPPHAGGRAHAV